MKYPRRRDYKTYMAYALARRAWRKLNRIRMKERGICIE